MSCWSAPSFCSSGIISSIYLQPCTWPVLPSLSPTGPPFETYGEQPKPSLSRHSQARCPCDDRLATHRQTCSLADSFHRLCHQHGMLRRQSLEREPATTFLRPLCPMVGSARVIPARPQSVQS